MDEIITARKKKYLEFDLTFQPSMFIVTSGDSPIFYTTFDGILYKLPTFLKCIDSCFKIIQILNLKYSTECCNIWTFLQRKVYKIITPYDKCSPSVRILENRIDKALASDLHQ